MHLIIELNGSFMAFVLRHHEQINSVRSNRRNLKNEWIDLKLGRNNRRHL